MRPGRAFVCRRPVAWEYELVASMNRILAQTSVCLIASLALAACSDEEPGNSDAAVVVDSGALPEDAGVEADAGTPDAGELERRCTEPVEPSCVDEQITTLALFRSVSPGAITQESAEAGVFVSRVDARAGGAAPNQSYVYARFTRGGLEKVSVSDEASFDSMDWDIAFRRYIIRTNGGVSGPSCTEVARVPGNVTFDALASVPDNLTFRTEGYFTDGTCDIVPDGSGLGAPAVAMGSFWSYQMCVQMTGNVFVLALADGSHIKAEVLSYYEPAAQETCNQTGSAPQPSGAGYIRLKWSYLE